MSATHLLIVLGAVWVATAACVFGLGWQARGWAAERRAARPVPYRLILDGYQATSPGPDWPPRQVHLPVAGHLWAGAADPAFEAPRAAGRTSPLPLLDDAMAAVERQQLAADVHREVEAIWAEVEANPERWQS